MNLLNDLKIKAVLFTPKIWQQTVRHRGKFNVKMPKPRHDIARYLEEITKPVLIKEIPDPTEKCAEAKNRIALRLKFNTDTVHILFILLFICRQIIEFIYQFLGDRI